MKAPCSDRATAAASANSTAGVDGVDVDDDKSDVVVEFKAAAADDFEAVDLLCAVAVDASAAAFACAAAVDDLAAADIDERSILE